MYQKTTAKNGRHEPADVTNNIAALSRIVRTQRSRQPVPLHSGGDRIATSMAPTRLARPNEFSYSFEYPTIESQQQWIPALSRRYGALQ